MGIFDKLKFLKGRAKPKEEPDYSTMGLTSPTLGPPENMNAAPPNPMEPVQRQPLPQLPMPPEKPIGPTKETVTQDNMKAKLDLLATQLESIRIQQEATGQRVSQIEQIVRQILDLARR